MKNTCPHTTLTTDQNKSLKTESITLAAIYLIVLLVPLIHNIYSFIYKQKRYRVCTVTVFYTFAMILVMMRIAGFSAYAIAESQLMIS